MYSNQPVSMRCARTVRVRALTTRSETQLQALPASSGCMVRRNRTVSSACSRISTFEYSLNSDGQEATSLVISQTSSIGASITTALSVCAAMSRARGQEAVDVSHHGTGGALVLHDVVGDRYVELALDPAGQLQYRQRVVAQVAERHLGDVAIERAGVTGTLTQDTAKVVQGERGHRSSPPRCRPPRSGRR